MNRIKNLRKQKKWTQKELAIKFNNFLGFHSEYKNIKPINAKLISKWENKTNSPSKATFKALAAFFNVSIPFLQGVFTKEEILKVLQDTYINGYSENKQLAKINKYLHLPQSIDNYLIASGVIPYNIPQENYLLNKEQINDFNFWINNFNAIFDNLVIKWLITKPMDTTPEDIKQALNEALVNLTFSVSTNYIDPFNYLNSDKLNNIIKRKDFLEKHLANDNDGLPYYNFKNK